MKPQESDAVESAPVVIPPSNTAAAALGVAGQPASPASPSPSASTTVDTLLPELDAVAIPEANDTPAIHAEYERLWQTLDNHDGRCNATAGEIAWLKGDILNRYHPLPELEAKGWRKPIPESKLNDFLAQHGVSRSNGWLLRKMRARFNREQARNLGYTGMRDEILGRPEAAIDLAATACGDNRWSNPVVDAVNKHASREKAKREKRPFDLSDLADKIQASSDGLAALLGKVMAAKPGDGEDDRKADRQALRRARGKLKLLGEQIKALRVTITGRLASLATKEVRA